MEGVLIIDIDKFFQVLPQFLILLPSAASCYLPAKNRMKYSPAKTAALFIAAILPFSIAAALLCTLFYIDVNAILLSSLVPFFFLYRRTINLDPSCTLAVYVGVCAVETFPVQFSYAFDAWLHPASGAADISPEAVHSGTEFFVDVALKL